MDLIGAAGKIELEGVIDDVHDTFKRPLWVYKDNEVTIIATNPSFNSVYQAAADAAQDNKTIELVKQEFYCRVFYYNQFNRPVNVNDSSVLGLETTVGRVRIKCDNEAHAFIKDAKRLEFDGYKFEIMSMARPVGLFNQARWEIHLKNIL